MVQTQTVPKIAHTEMVQTQACFVQVPLHLHRRLHAHVDFEEASAERGIDGFLMASFILFSVAEVDWIRERPIAK